MGAYYEPNIFGSFTLKPQAYNGGTLLGTVTESGVSTSTPGTALFIGALNKTGPNTTKVVFSGTTAPTTDFAIGTMYRGTPEPRSGPLGLAGFARRRTSKWFRKARVLSSRSARTDIKNRLSRRPFVYWRRAWAQREEAIARGQDGLNVCNIMLYFGLQ